MRTLHLLIAISLFATSTRLLAQDYREKLRDAVSDISQLYVGHDRKFSEILSVELKLVPKVHQSIRKLGLSKTIESLGAEQSFEFYYVLGCLLSGRAEDDRNLIISSDEREQVFQAICMRLLSTKQADFRDAYSQYVVWCKKLDFGLSDERSIESFSIRLRQICLEDSKPFWESLAMLLVISHLMNSMDDDLEYHEQKKEMQEEINRSGMKKSVLELFASKNFELVGGFKYRQLKVQVGDSKPSSKEEFLMEYRKRVPQIVFPLVPFPNTDPNLIRFLNLAELNREFRDTVW